MKSREENVLKWLIRDYANSGQPVGSTRLVSMDYFQVGSATIRNVLSNLETGGYLLQPHTSSGRIPTDKGYRYFVDRLMQSDLPEGNIMNDYENGISNLSSDLDQLIKSTAQFLGDMSHALVLMSKPHKRSSMIKSLVLHELDKESVLLIVHTTFDEVKSIAFELESTLSRVMLQEAENILNKLFSGRDLVEIQNMVETGSMERERKNPIIDAIVSHFDKLLNDNTVDDYRVYGTHQLLQYPEMAEPMNLEILLEAIETDNLQRYLPIPLRTGQPSVLIGAELGQEVFNNMSLVSVSYDGLGCSGEIHILGPTRMAYEKIIGLAEFTATKMENMINTKYMK